MKQAMQLAMCVALLAGCGSVKHFNYDSQVTPRLTASAPIRVAVGVLDHRPMVLSGSWPVSVAGFTRGGVGQVYKIHTLSGEPLADDMSWTLVRALDMRGIDGQQVFLRPAMSHEDAVAALKATDCDRLVLVVLDRWKSDTYAETNLSYDVTVEVLSETGSMRVRRHTEGYDHLGTRPWRQTRYAHKAVAKAYGGKFEDLLNDPNVVRAIESDAWGTAQ
ncbi:MAG: hypothetical protein GY851_13700 [bacterium]|nr:hypothetical protein [bacterium]